MSPRKVRIVANAIRGLDMDEAEVFLEGTPRRAAVPVLKLLRSAAANAVHNNQKDRATLFIQSITVDKGPVIKRFRARAFGRAADIRKHTSHIVLTLGEHAKAAPKRFKRPAAHQEKSTSTLEELSADKTEKKSQGAHVAKDKKQLRGGAPQKRIVDIGKRFFRRKSV